jgi:hypothetical protein
MVAVMLRSTSRKSNAQNSPDFYFKMTQPNIRRDLYKWRSIWNSEGRQITPDECSSMEIGDKKKGWSHDNSGHNNSGGKGKNRNTHKKRSQDRKSRRITNIQTVGIQEGGVDVHFKDTEDEDSLSDDGEKQPEQDPMRLKRSMNREGPSGESQSKKRGKIKKSRRFPVAPRGSSTSEVPRVIVDPGSEVALVCEIAWTAIEKLNVNTQVFGAIQGSRGDELATVHAVTVFEHQTLGTILLGVGNAEMTKSLEQTESLLNSHHLRFNGVTVDDTAERDGGKVYK